MAQIIKQGLATENTDFLYTPPDDEPGVLFFCGGAYADQIGTVGYDLYINNVKVATTSVYCNAVSMHMTLNPVVFNYAFDLSIGHDGSVVPVRIQILPTNTNTRFDVNDSITLAIL